MANIFISLGQLLQKYVDSGATTTSTTTVTAQPVGSAAQPTTLTLASAVGFSAFDRVVFDVENRQETSVIESVSGSTIVVLARLAHTGTFPVTVEGGESIIRELLRKLRDTEERLHRASGTAGIQQADEVRFYASSRNGTSKSRLDELIDYQRYLRKELARTIGTRDWWDDPQGSGGGVAEMY